MLDASVCRYQELTAAAPDPLLFRNIVIATRQHLRAEQQVSRMALADAERQTDKARACLASARMAAEAVDRLITERTTAARAEADRRAQHVLDDIARGP